MSGLFEFIKPYFQNQLFTGGFLLMMSGAIMALCRSLPARAWNWTLARLTVSATVYSHDPAYEYLLAWLNSISYSRRARNLEVSIARENKPDNTPTDCASDQLPKFLFTPSIGNHLFVHKHNVMWLSRESENAPTAKTSGAMMSKLQTIRIRCFGHSQDPIRQIMEDAARAFLDPSDDRVKIMVARYDYWQTGQRIRARSPESVVLPDGEWERLIADCRWFLAAEDFYHNLGVPYRRGYLLEGVPGSGKTATVEAIAGVFRLPLYMMTVAGWDMSDRTLGELFSRLPVRCIVLMEDIDAAFDERVRDKDNDSRVTFSGLLNALDGVGSSERLLLFMTTNHVDRLDTALIRPGRCDVRLTFRAATVDQVERLHLRFFPYDGRLAARTFAIWLNGDHPSMADLQARFIERSIAGLQEERNGVRMC